MNDILPPVKVSASARSALTYYMRQWSGWGSKATLVLGETPGGLAACYHDPKYQIVLDVDALSLNPNRVLKTVTPFRLRQEAVLTGALLHEAGHARHSHWQPGRYGNPDQAVHSDGSPVTELVLEFAKCLEEARVEGLLAAEATDIGAGGLAWTMQCSAMKVLPLTEVSTDPGQAVLDVVVSWVLRAGRQISTGENLLRSGNQMPPLPPWVQQFNLLLNEVVKIAILSGKPEGDSPEPELSRVMNLLFAAVRMGPVADKPGSTYMVDVAKEILDILFPEDMQGGLSAQSGCPEQADSDESDSDESDSDESDSNSDSAESDSAESDSSDSDSGESPLQQVITALEQATAKTAQETKASETANPSEPMVPGKPDADSDTQDPGNPTGASAESGPGKNRIKYRQPAKAEREVKNTATEFLRNIVNPSESSKPQITDSPSATVDGAALAAWKAGGQRSDPLFFRRVRRVSQPAAPVKVAILVDVSASMNVLQKPSALLSWALSSACLDLRNFAGRGVQVESTLIHWGSSARVIQANGQTMPGIHEGACNESTRAMAEALDLVAEQLPGFFEPTERPSNRLLVQFTDWELPSWGGRGTVALALAAETQRIDKALSAGVNMLSVVPMNYSWRKTSLDTILARCRNQVGRTSLLKYDTNQPEQVWTAATELLSGADSTYGF